MTLIELLVAMAITVIIAGVMAAAAAPLRLDFEARIEATDVEQRLRTAGDALSADLLMAGAGVYA
ncbi:MAG: PilW family protein, partial [Acetobacteraceae bacterium]